MDKLNQLTKLTSLRYFAALYVVAFHYIDVFAGFNEFLVLTIHHGYVAVSFFFILSGYILTYNYLKYAGNINYRQFLKKRFIKLYPAYITALLISFIFGLYFYINSPESRSTIFIDSYIFISSIFMFQSWTPHLLSSIMNVNAPGWSLSVEMFLYISFPFILLFFNRINNKYLISIFLLYISITIYFIVYFLINTPNANYFLLSNDNNTIPTHLFVQVFPLLHIPEFALGVLASILVNRKIIVQNFIFNTFFYFSIVAILILININVLPGYLMNNGILGVFFIVIIIKSHLSNSLNLLDNRFLVKLGDASYHLYIFAWPIGRMFSIFYLKTNIITNLQLQFLIYIVSLSAISLFTNSIESKLKSYYLNPIK